MMSTIKVKVIMIITQVIMRKIMMNVLGCSFVFKGISYCKNDG